MKSLQKHNMGVRFPLPFLIPAILLAVLPIPNHRNAGDVANAAALLTGAAGSSGTATNAADGNQAGKSKEEALKAQDKDGLPVPENYTGYEGEKSAYHQSLTASSPSSLKTVLAFYNRELKSRHWREPSGSGKIADAKAVLSFENAKQELLSLNLTRNGKGGTDIRVIIKSKTEAMKDGVLPSPGKARIYLGNMTDGQAEFSFGPKKIVLKKQSTNEGSIKNAPFIEVAPGAHHYVLSLAGQKPIHDKIEVGTDETWGLIAGPGGAMPMQLY
jgi:hypothetical protein